MSPVVRCVAGGLLFPESPLACDDGSILVSEVAAGRVTRVGPDGRCEPVAETGGGPNGLARLPDGRLLVCQNGGSRWDVAPWPYDLPGCARLFRPVGTAEEPVTPQVQVVTTDGQVTTLATSFVSADGATLPLERPSDVCVDAAGGYYLTDGGATRGRVRTLSGLLYGTAEGSLREVLFPLEMANGVALSADGGTLYVAETRTRRVWECEIVAPGVVGRARGLATVPSGGPLNVGGADGVCVDRAGRVVVATLGAGGVTVFSPLGTLLGALPMDDPMTTSATVGTDGDVLFVTLASSGRLVAVDGWHRLFPAAEATDG